jgi:hypothetical protein
MATTRRLGDPHDMSTRMTRAYIRRQRIHYFNSMIMKSPQTLGDLLTKDPWRHHLNTWGLENNIPLET